MIPLVAALFGLVIGSFLNVVIHRLPLKQSLVRPASHCPRCGEGIEPRDNIPLLSYAVLRGRCRNCGARISVRYPMIEAITGALFAAAAFKFGLSLQLVSALILIASLVSLAGIDLEHRLLPNVIIGPATLTGLAVSILSNPEQWWIYPVSAAVIAAGLLLLALVYPGGMGMGDVKMGGMLGVFLGPYAALAVFLGALTGALTGGLMILLGKMERRSAMPFGVFMALGGLFSLFFGPELWWTYLSAAGGI